MKVYLKHVVQQLRQHTLSLGKKTILIDKPWALIDDEFEMSKLIFKKNNELILSKNGQVQIGKWEYFPEAKSLLIDRNIDKILCNEGFIDEGVMILKLDGTNNRFFVLANENLIPDLNVERYLKELRYNKLNIAEKKLVDGKIVEVEMFYENQYNPRVGNFVTINAVPVDDGKYQFLNHKDYYEISDGKIAKILNEKKYTNPDGLEIIIHQQNSWISWGIMFLFQVNQQKPGY